MTPDDRHTAYQAAGEALGAAYAARDAERYHRLRAGVRERIAHLQADASLQGLGSEARHMLLRHAKMLQHVLKRIEHADGTPDRTT